MTGPGKLFGPPGSPAAARRPRAVWTLLTALAVAAGLTLSALILSVRESLPSDKPGIIPGTLVGAAMDAFAQLASLVVVLLALTMLTLACTALYGAWAARPWTTAVAGTLAGLLLLTGGLIVAYDPRAGLPAVLTALVLIMTLTLNRTQTYLNAEPQRPGTQPRPEWPDQLPGPGPD